MSVYIVMLFVIAALQAYWIDTARLDIKALQDRGCTTLVMERQE